MGARFDEAYVKNIQDDIRLACKTLEELGYDSLMVISSSDRHMELGSAKGRSFIETYPDYFEDFINYCQVKVEIQDDYSAEEHNQLSLPVCVPTVVIQPVRAGTIPQKRKGKARKKLPVSKPVSHEPDVTDGLDGAFDDGDESGLEFEDDHDQGHTIDTVKIAKRTNKRSKGRKHKALKKQKVLITSALQEVNAAFKMEKKPPVKKTGEQPKTLLYCDTCGKAYNTKKSLVVHQRLHTGETPYPCPTCGKGFRSSSLLASHMAYHSTEKKYTCDKCGKAFQWRGSFNTHKRNAHTEERPHICDVCGARFKDVGVLRKHAFRHSGQRPHSCEKCGKSFTQRYSLKNHLKTHEAKVPKPKRFTCGVCSTQFTQKSTVTKHLRRKHPHHVPIIYMLKDVDTRNEDDYEEEEFMEDE